MTYPAPLTMWIHSSAELAPRTRILPENSLPTVSRLTMPIAFDAGHGDGAVTKRLEPRSPDSSPVNATKITDRGDAPDPAICRASSRRTATPLALSSAPGCTVPSAPTPRWS